MNREQKRKFVKNQKKRGVKESEAKAYAEIISHGSGQNTPPNSIAEGDKVKLNIDAITARQNYNIMSGLYKEFVTANKDEVFTAHVERENLISFIEEPRWIFWSGDLVLIEHADCSSEVLNNDSN